MLLENIMTCIQKYFYALKTKQRKNEQTNKNNTKQTLEQINDHLLKAILLILTLSLMKTKCHNYFCHDQLDQGRNRL